MLTFNVALRCNKKLETVDKVGHFGAAVLGGEFKQITTAAVTEKIWGEYVSVV